MPGAGLEPARAVSPRDFKSRASANFAIPAKSPERGNLRGRFGQAAQRTCRLRRGGMLDPGSHTWIQLRPLARLPDVSRACDTANGQLSNITEKLGGGDRIRTDA
jgi:hypothetical protein